MRYPIVVVLIFGGLVLLAWMVSGRRLPVLVHAGAVLAALATLAFLLWLRRGGTVIEPEAWVAVVAVPVLVYVNFAFIRAMHGAEKSDGTAREGALPPPTPAAPEAWTPRGSDARLTPDEETRAGALSIWPIWWELPDKSWEALCLDANDANRLLALQQDDHRLKSWGKTGKGERRTLLEWHQGVTRGKKPSDIGDQHRTVREVLRRADAGEREPLVIRTW